MRLPLAIVATFALAGCGGAASDPSAPACLVTQWDVWGTGPDGGYITYAVPAPASFISLPQTATCGGDGVQGVYDEQTGEDLCGATCSPGAACVAMIWTVDGRTGVGSYYPYSGTCE